MLNQPVWVWPSTVTVSLRAANSACVATSVLVARLAGQASVVGNPEPALPNKPQPERAEPAGATVQAENKWDGIGVGRTRFSCRESADACPVG